MMVYAFNLIFNEEIKGHKVLKYKVDFIQLLILIDIINLI